jgi:hypothetical protein
MNGIINRKVHFACYLPRTNVLPAPLRYGAVCGVCGRCQRARQNIEKFS